MPIERNIRHGLYGRHTIAKADNGKPSRVLGEGWTVKDGVRTEHYTFEHSIKDKNIRHERSFAMKRYQHTELARQVCKKYIHCREAGLPVPATFGIDENDPRTVIASDLSCDGKFLVESANIYQADIPKSTRVENIIGIPALSKQIARTGALAAARGIRLTGDAVFFIFPAVGGTVSVDFAIGDYDNDYFIVNGADASETLGLKNAEIILDALLRWVRKWPAERLPDQAREAFRMEVILTAHMRKEFPKAFALAKKLTTNTMHRISRDRIIAMAWSRKKSSST